MVDPTSPSTWRLHGSTEPTSLESHSRRQESSGESTAYNVDTADMYRQGFPNPLRPLPQTNFIVTQADAEKMPWCDLTIQAAVRFLQARDIEWGSVTIINRRGPQDEPDKYDLTILIAASRDTNSDSWYLMLQDLYGYLQEHDLLHLRVEMLDPRYARVPDHHIVEHSHPLVAAWPDLRDRIIKVLGSSQWLTLTAIRRGIHMSPKENPITILITAPDPPSLSPMSEIILSICRDMGFSLRLEILKERTALGSAKPGGILLTRDAFVDSISVGSSVGRKFAEDSSGTIGGTIVLSRGNSHIRMGVTNFHVIQSQGILDQYVDHGLPPHISLSAGIQAVVPSDQDTAFTLDCLREQMGGDLEQLLAEKRERYKTFGDERDANYIRTLESRQQLTRQLMDRIQTFNRGAGSLFAASGFRVHPQTNFGLDWALTQLPSHRPTSNLLPTYDEINALDGSADYFPPNDLKLEEWSSECVYGGAKVYKKGRTTGLTRGTFSSIHPSVNLGKKICSAWQVVGKVGKDFYQPGDSGSFLFDSLGRWCAILFATPYRSTTGDGYVLPVDELIADIEGLTGGIVSLP